MQENYVSLDPANAESMTYQVRKRLWQQRLTESLGGQGSSVLGVQFFLTASMVTYAGLKRGGFRMTSFAASKVPQYAGMFFSGYIAHQFALSLTRGNIGDIETYNHLIDNKKKIIAGDASWDPEK